MIFWLTLTYLLAFLKGVKSEMELIESGEEAKRPGEALRLSCQASGFPFSTYHMDWVRQAPGKRLEWVAWIRKDAGEVHYSEQVKGRFTISRDNSKSQLHLQMDSLKTEDTAVYYCTRDRGSSAFDYWGKGTMVTVTNESPVSPSLFPLIPSGNSLESSDITIGCLAKNFLPDAVTFSWNNPNNQSISNFKKFPSIRDSSGLYSAASQTTVPLSDWNNFSPFYCKADHSQGNKVARVVRQESTPQGLEPEMIVRAPPLRAFSNSFLNSTITCEVTNLCSDKVKLQWLKEQTVLTSGFTTSRPIPSGSGSFTIRSKLVVTKQDWVAGKVFSCDVKSKQYNNTMDISNVCEDPTCKSVEVETIPPSFADIYQTSSAKLTCRVSNIPFGQDISQLNVTWRRASDNTQLGTVLADPKEQENDMFYTDATATVCATEWKSEVFICKVTFEGLLVKPVEKSLKKDNDGTPYMPSVYILPPPSEQLALREMATLTCLVKGYYPKEVFVQWLHNEKPISGSNYYTSQPVIDSKMPKQYFSLSMLTITEEQWSKGDSFTCVVGHETLPFNTTQKTVDKNTGKPSIVNVSLVLSDTGTTCY